MNNKDQILNIEISDDAVYLHLADGRLIGNPLEWHPWLQNATSAQRENVELYEMSVYFPDLDERLDAIEMMKGMPPRLARKQAEVVG
jgi:hypothetical protein